MEREAADQGVVRRVLRWFIVIAVPPQFKLRFKLAGGRYVKAGRVHGDTGADNRKIEFEDIRDEAAVTRFGRLPIRWPKCTDKLLREVKLLPMDGSYLINIFLQSLYNGSAEIFH